MRIKNRSAAKVRGPRGVTDQQDRRWQRGVWYERSPNRMAKQSIVTDNDHGVLEEHQRCGRTDVVAELWGGRGLGFTTGIPLLKPAVV
jgi:hypothetical protein